MYCSNCGHKNLPQDNVCFNCGRSLRDAGGIDKPNWGINILSLCCFPLLGLIMYFVWKDDKPQAAKSALVFFFVAIGIWIGLNMFFMLLGALSGI